MPDRIGKEMLAPCGFDCIVCYRHLKPKGFCRGCLTDDEAGKTAHCRACNIKECAKGKKIVYCFECSEFPCKALENMDRNYVKRYGVSLVNNGARARALCRRRRSIGHVASAVELYHYTTLSAVNVR